MSGDRIEPGLNSLAWFKSSYSAGDGGECLEVAVRPATVHVRDSKDTTRAALAIEPTAWAVFVEFAAR
ncbi:MULTISPECIES: DUF397 domain-containing protein [unclassified Streptomyces]|uniref:DUF397 domain-containing protein n=1 Tax=unclassified Streptomyces TaxID=2593676 RepID=UPI000F711D56|nr:MULTISPECIES: DUF397 domain-containing protein [unclassified Streptomyces]AZM58891.1 DUF397 domain-containing protein [Streptomyces sp. WAC 01438]RSM93204.1 DUF397 domain-containing protein [Streptomyces sp. WAC 01420]